MDNIASAKDDRSVTRGVRRPYMQQVHLFVIEVKLHGVIVGYDRQRRLRVRLLQVFHGNKINHMITQHLLAGVRLAHKPSATRT